MKEGKNCNEFHFFSLIPFVFPLIFRCVVALSLSLSSLTTKVRDSFFPFPNFLSAHSHRLRHDRARSFCASIFSLDDGNSPVVLLYPRRMLYIKYIRTHIDMGGFKETLLFKLKSKWILIYCTTARERKPSGAFDRNIGCRRVISSFRFVFSLSKNRGRMRTVCSTTNRTFCLMFLSG